MNVSNPNPPQVSRSPYSTCGRNLIKWRFLPPCISISLRIFSIGEKSGLYSLQAPISCILTPWAVALFFLRLEIEGEEMRNKDEIRIQFAVESQPGWEGSGKESKRCVVAVGCFPLHYKKSVCTRWWRYYPHLIASPAHLTITYFTSFRATLSSRKGGPLRGFDLKALEHSLRGSYAPG